jgi:hypothetical protein
MGQVSRVMRRGEGRYFHWCPGCEEMHPLPDGWTFNGDLERPTFSPSFAQGGMQTVQVDGKWTGEWVRDGEGKPVPRVCHYFVEEGRLRFLDDCTHPLAGKTIDMPDLPAHLRD